MWVISDENPASTFVGTTLFFSAKICQQELPETERSHQLLYNRKQRYISLQSWSEKPKNGCLITDKNEQALGEEISKVVSRHT